MCHDKCARLLAPLVLLWTGVCAQYSANDSDIGFTLWPPAITAPYYANNGVNRDESTELMVNVSVNNPQLLDSLRLLKIEFGCADTKVCRVANQSKHLLLVDGRPMVSMNLTVLGTFVGKTWLTVQLESEPANLPLTHDLDYRIHILRTADGQVLQDALIGVMVVFVSINTFMMGTQLRLAAIKNEVSRPIGPAVGFCCQYILMPLLGWLWSETFLSDWPHLQFGFFVLSCSPGGGASNMWTILLEGKLDLSMTMTFFSNIAAIVMMPIWLYTVGLRFYGAGNLQIPFSAIARSLATLIIPSCLGMVFSHYKPQFIPRFRRGIKIFTFFILIFVIGFSTYSSLYIYELMTWYTVVPSMCLPWSAFALSYCLAYVLTRSHQTARTIAIETGIQNGGIAILLCLLSLPEPDSALTIVMPASCMLLTMPPLWGALAFRTIRKRCCGYIDEEVAAEELELAKATKQPAESGKAQVGATVAPGNRDKPPAPAYLPATPKESEC